MSRYNSKIVVYVPHVPRVARRSVELFADKRFKSRVIPNKKAYSRKRAWKCEN